MNILEILQDCPLFSEVRPSGFQRLAVMARLCHFRGREAIFRENEPCPGVFVVGQGLVRIFKTNARGKEHVLHIVGPGESFAEVAAIGGFSTPAAATAEKKTTCALLPLDPFRRALAEDHELCLDMMAGLAHWVRHLVTLVEDIALRDATGRLARYLLDLAATKSKSTGGKIGVRTTTPSTSSAKAINPSSGDVVRLPDLKRHVACHLNLTSETFSRTMRRMIDAGWIADEGQSRIRILRPQKLRQAAEVAQNLPLKLSPRALR